MADITAPGPTAADAGPERAGPIVAADGTPLKRKLAVSMRRARWRAFLLTAPLLLFVVLTFILPIGQMLTRSVHNDTFPATRHRSHSGLGWSGAAG